MKKALFLSPRSHNISSTQISAFVRILRWFSKNVPACEFIEYDRYMQNDCIRNVDTIVYFYSAFYAQFDHIIQFMERYPNSKVCWFSNESTLHLNSSIRKYFHKRGFDFITNLHDGYSKETQEAKNIHVVNVNVTAYKDNIALREFNDREYDLIYYGSFKSDRIEYIQKYFSDALISTSSKNVMHYKASGLAKSKYIHPLVFGKNDSTLNRCKFSVYIENLNVHGSKFCFMSDRFYECISNGVVLFFDKNCEQTVLQSGYNIDNFFFVDSRDELNEKMKHISNDKALRDSYLKNVLSQIKDEQNSLRENFQNVLSS